jgi:hypothetical protein
VNLRLLRRVAPLGFYLSGLCACGLFSSRQTQPNDWNADVSVEVESHNTSDIVVYLMNGGQSQRLGMVPAVSTATFVVPYRQLATGGKVRLRAYQVGGRGSFTSEDVLLQPGQGVRWTLESDLSRSSLSVY